MRKLPEILQIGHPILREKAQTLSLQEINQSSTQKFIKTLEKTMMVKDGAGLAANQIGQALRIIAVAIPAEPESGQKQYPQIFINPEIIEKSEKTEIDWEGCLSIKDRWGKVERSTRIIVQSMDHKGRSFTLEAYGMLARVIQHEIDHTQGILFVDRMKDPTDLISTEEIQEIYQGAPSL